MKPLVKTSGSRGLHVYVPIVRGPLQEDVLTFAKALATELAARHPKVLTVEYRKSTRPRGRVLVDYRQNAWGQTLASIYSVRPRPEATVSAPLTWDEVEKGVEHRGLPARQRARPHRQARRPVEAALRRARPHGPRGRSSVAPRERLRLRLRSAPRARSRRSRRRAARAGCSCCTARPALVEHARVRADRTASARRRPAGGERHARVPGASPRPARAERRRGGVSAHGCGPSRGRRTRRRGMGRARASRAEAEAGRAHGVRGPARPGPALHGEILARRFQGRRTRPAVGLPPADLCRGAVDAIGHMPLPPYIKRADRPDDRERYQTVYAASPRLDCRADRRPALHAIRCSPSWRRAASSGPTSPCTSATARSSRCASSAWRITRWTPRRSRCRRRPPPPSRGPAARAGA